METLEKSPLLTPFFYVATVENTIKSKEAGRPIFDEVEMVEIRMAADRNYNPHFPAHEMHVREMGEEITHAMRWPEAYQRFKNQETQVASGTPLEELTFLTAARRSELKALKIYTAEALAALDGPNLKVLAGEGYRLKEQAQAYLDKAHGFAGTSSLVAENSQLREALKALQERMDRIDSVPDPAAQDAEPTNEELREEIKALTGKYPAGQPGRDFLIRSLNELKNAQAA